MTWHTQLRTAVLIALVACWTAVAVRAEPPFRLLAFGDSLTHGYGLDSPDSFPVRLQERLQAEGWDVQVINGGNSGDTSASGLARLDWSLADDPQAVIVELGANDMLRGLDPEQTEQNLDRIVAAFEAAGVKVLLAGMRAAPNWGRDYVERFDAIYPALAARHAVALYPFFLEGVAMDPGLNQPDGIHPNAAGVEEIVQRILPAVSALLQEAGATKESKEE